MLPIILDIVALMSILFFSVLVWRLAVKRSWKELPRILLYLNFIIGCLIILLTDIEISRVFLTTFIVVPLAVLIFALFWERKGSYYKIDG